MTIRLRISSDAGVEEVRLSDQRITVGRAPDSTIHIDAPNVSRLHAVIERTADGYRLVDLGSRNGTFLNASRVQSADLSKGDVIRVGNVYLYVEEVPETANIGRVQLQAVPEQDKGEVREKIDEVRRAIRRGSLRRAVATAVTALSLLVLAGAGIVAAVILMKKASVVREEGPRAKGGEAAGADEGEKLRSEGLALLEDLRRQVEAAPIPTREHIARGQELQAKYSPHFTSESGVVADPFQAMLNDLLARRQAALSERFEPTRRSVEDALRRRDFAAAAAELRAFDAEVGGGYEPAARLLQEVEDEAMLAFGTLRSEIELFKRYKKYDEIISLCRSYEERFRGTPYRSQLLTEADIAVQMKASEEAVAQRRQVPEEIPERAAPEPAPAGPGRAGPAPLTGLRRQFAELAAAGRIRSLDLEGRTVRVTGADEAGIRTDAGVVEWSRVDTGALAEAMIDAAPEPDLPKLAELCHLHGREQAGERALYRYWKGDPSRKPEVDAILAAWRKLSSPPEGGYTWNANRNRWEDALEKSSAEALAAAEKLARRLRSASNESALDGMFESARKLLKEEIGSRARQEVRDLIAAALEENKKKRLEEISRRAKRPAGDVSQAAQRLEDARRECLRVMYDTKIYYPEGHPRYEEGLRAYRAVRDPLWNIWRGNWSGTLDTSLAAAIRLVEKVNRFLRELGAPAGDELTGKELEEYVANASVRSGQLNIRNYALTRQQRETYDYNDAVDRYNNTTYKSRYLASTGAGPETIEHLNILNEWREALGRRKLFMDARLQRAAQKHAQAQAAAGKIWHVGPNGSPSSRAQAEGFDGPVGENCCIGFPSAKAAFMAWDEASDHCRNQCSDNWNCAGVGHVGSVWVQDFGRTTPPPEIGR